MKLTLPRWSDHFPTTRRGHGAAKGQLPVDKVASFRWQKKLNCVAESCQLSKRNGEAHDNKAANIDDWRDEHGLLRPKKKGKKDQQSKVEPYVSAPRILHATKIAPRSMKCESCGHVPVDEKKHDVLSFGICYKCWRRGTGWKMKKTQGTEQQAAA